jgi:SNF2 family DNA or RNA helicase
MSGQQPTRIQPCILAAPPRSYKNGVNGILADEMGLGKTLQTIGFISYLWSNTVRPFTCMTL